MQLAASLAAFESRILPAPLLHFAPGIPKSFLRGQRQCDLNSTARLLSPLQNKKQLRQGWWLTLRCLQSQRREFWFSIAIAKTHRISRLLG